MSVSITFLGGSGTVTGSKYLVRHNGKSMLMDCGLFQGYKQLRLRNWQPLPLSPHEIDSVVLTHAHLDHSGYLPLLARDGYHRDIHATRGTRDLCAILLPDSGHLQEEDAAFLNRHKLSSHSPALPLYTRLDALHCLKQFKPHGLHQRFEPLPGWHATFSNAGHILGAASVLLEVGGRRILFSGDLGRPDDMLMNPAEDLLSELGPALARLAARGGVAVVPVFAVGRAQVVLHAIGLLKAQGVIPASLKVFLDSPMAVSTTGLYQHHLGEHRLNAREVNALEHGATMVQTPEQSKGLARLHGPMVILAASGMATGGRVLHHLALHSGDHRNMIILTGHQAPGTRGARLADGERSIRIHGQDVAVRAEVVKLNSASAHADSHQLIAWLRSMEHAPDRVFVVHGEMSASDQLRQRISHELHWQAQVPEHGCTVEL